MDKKINLDNYKRKEIYLRFLHESYNTICVSGEFDITKIFKYSKKGHKLNCMLLYCIQQAANKIEDFHYRIKNKELFYSERVLTCSVAKGKDGLLYYITYPYENDYLNFKKKYKELNDNAYNNCEHYWMDEGTKLSTSAMVGFPFLSISSDVQSDYSNHYLLWGNYRRSFLKIKLNISFKFHHALLDGEMAVIFFNKLQEEFDNFKSNM